MTLENIDLVKKRVKEDPYFTFCDLERTLNIGSAVAQIIVYNHSWLTKTCSRWMPHSLIERQKNAREDWCHFKLKNSIEGSSKAPTISPQVMKHGSSNITLKSISNFLCSAFQGRNHSQKFEEVRALERKWCQLFLRR